jgi:3-dehydroquinate synthetase
MKRGISQGELNITLTGHKQMYKVFGSSRGGQTGLNSELQNNLSDAFNNPKVINTSREGSA